MSKRTMSFDAIENADPDGIIRRKDPGEGCCCSGWCVFGKRISSFVTANTSSP
jgi:hypothetical protein